MELNTIYNGDCLEVLKTLPNESINCVVTSPPYWGLRDYGVEGQLGLEKTPEEYVDKMVEVFREVKRVLIKDGTCWLNLGDSYATTGNVGVGGSDKQNSNKGSVCYERDIDPGLRSKNLVGIPWRVAFALQSDGWYLRQDIIWAKPNPMPESVTDRCTKSHEYIFLLTKNAKYYFNNEPIREPVKESNEGFIIARSRLKQGEMANDGSTWENKRRDYTEIKGANKRSVWTVTTKPFRAAHFATFPEALIDPMIKAGCPVGGVVLDIFMGAGTTAVVAKKLNRNYFGIELNPEYIKIAEKRIIQTIINEELFSEAI